MRLRNIKPWRGSSTIVARHTRIGAKALEERGYTIPETSPTRYLSGMAALNIIAGRGTGDWHDLGAFLRSRKNTPRAFLCGEGESINSIPYFGDDGVFDYGPLLLRMGVIDREQVVYAATHARAIADMALACILSGDSAEFIALDNWMPKPEHKVEVWQIIEKAMVKLDDSYANGLRGWFKRASIER